MSIVFEYRGWERGHSVKSTQRATDRTQAAEILSTRGVAVTWLRPRTSAFSLSGLFKSITGSDLAARIAFYRGYAALESKGVPFDDACALLLKHAPKGRFKESITALDHAVRIGERISKAMADRPDEFGQLETAMIAAGEEGGNRADVLGRIAEFLERDAVLRKRLLGAMTYPLTVIGATIAMSLFIFMWLLPTFAHYYTDYQVAMPTVMLVALAISNAMQSPFTWPAIAAIITALGFAVNTYIGSENGAMQVDRIAQADVRIFGLNFWPFGEIRRKTIASRVGRALAALMKSGVDIDKALESVVSVAESPVVGSALQQARKALSGGEVSALSEALALYRVLDSYFLGFLEIGEESSQVPEMLECVAGYYDQDVEMQLQTLPEKLLVIVVAALGILVFLLAYIVYVPMSTLSAGIH